jgi:hypothetical protein
MAVREFDGVDDLVELAAGTLGTLVQGANSFVVIAKLVNDNDKALVSFGAAANPLAGLVVFSNAGQHQPGYQSNAGGTLVAGVDLTASDGWLLIGFSKASGSNKPRLHVYDYGGAAWTHVDADNAVADQPTNTVTRVAVGQDAAGSNKAAIRLAVFGVWKSRLADADYESGMHSSLGAWSALTPDALCPFNQASTADPVADVTGNGADQTSITGTTVITGDDPPGFSFASTTTVGRDLPAAWDVLALAGRDAGLSWPVRVLAGRDAPAEWNTAALAGRDAATGWDTRALAGRDATVGFDTRALAGRSAATAFAVRALAGRDAATAWQVLALAGRAAPLRWRVLSLADDHGVMYLRVGAPHETWRAGAPLETWRAELDA